MATDEPKNSLPERFLASLSASRHIAPLAVLRMVFGAVMLASVLRFALKGWIYDFYVAPKFHFTFYGFGWVHAFSETGMYLVFALMGLCALLIMAGLFYRVAITLFFLSFTYVELIDKTAYLNHYYFISIFSFLLLLVPANRYFSLDMLRRPSLKVTQVPAWTIRIFKAQLVLVYFFAGLSKLNYDWLVEAMPLKIWLPANAHLPLIGPLLAHEWVAYAFSWFGLVFDLSIGFFLLRRSTVRPAYAVVLLFHVFTAWFFKIGMFPYIMMGVTVIFFSEAFHIRLIHKLRALLGVKAGEEKSIVYLLAPARQKLAYGLLSAYFLLQLLLPFRFMLYPGKLFWSEEGYRFSWRVMLMEKSGIAFFYVTDPKTGRSTEVINSRYLTRLQEKMMATQPDMLLQYAHYLADVYRQKGISDPVVTTQCYVTLNGSGSRLFIDSTVDLARQEESFATKAWILPFTPTSTRP